MLVDQYQGGLQGVQGLLVARAYAAAGGTRTAIAPFDGRERERGRRLEKRRKEDRTSVELLIRV